MKTNISNAGGYVRKSIGAVLALVLGGLTAVAQVFPDPTANDWDCIMSGARKGISQLTFNPDFTVIAKQVTVPIKKTASIDPRTGLPFAGSVDPRTGDVSNNPNLNGSQIFGYGIVSGQWGYDVNGRIIGFFTEVASGSDTNTPGITNAINFVGKAVTGKRLSLVCSTPFGKVSYRGVPLTLATNLDGTKWYGAKIAGGVTYQEFFSLVNGAYPNTYDVSGVAGGTASPYAGVCLVSVQRQIGFALAIGGVSPTNAVRATCGAFNPRSIIGSTRGWEQPAGPMTNSVSFWGRLQPVVIMPGS